MRNVRAKNQIFLIIAGLTVCFLFFQNMSLDKDYKDIRQIAPQAPEDEPHFKYFPAKFKSTNVHSLAPEILEHNFGAELRDIEDKIKDWGGWEHESQAGGAEGGTADARKKYKIRSGLLGKDRLGFSYESDFRVKCEYSAFSQDLALSLTKDFGPNTKLSLSHKTDKQQSSVNFSYSW